MASIQRAVSRMDCERELVALACVQLVNGMRYKHLASYRLPPSIRLLLHVSIDRPLWKVQEERRVSCAPGASQSKIQSKTKAVPSSRELGPGLLACLESPSSGPVD